MSEQAKVCVIHDGPHEDGICEEHLKRGDKMSAKTEKVLGTRCDCRIASITPQGDNADEPIEEIVYCRLHKAAPELLEALKDLLPMMEALHEVPDIRAAKARKAIAKAEGRE